MSPRVSGRERLCRKRAATSYNLVYLETTSHLIANLECAKTYTDDNFQIIGQAGSSFHLCVLESVYVKTQNPVLCRQKSMFSHWDSSSKQWVIGPNWSHLGPIRRILSHVTASGYIFRLTFRSLSNVFIL